MSLFQFSKIKISRKTKITFGILISVTALTVIVIGLWLAWNNMFRQNDRFYVVHVNVTSAEGRGKWHGKVKEVMPVVVQSKYDRKKSDVPKQELSPDDKLFSLFEIDVKKLRQKLEKVPEIEKVSVQRILPDTLDIRIVERIPVAFLARANSEKLVDRNAVVIRKSHSIDIAGLIPVIRNFKEALPGNGEVFDEIKSALEFIRLYREVGDFAVLKIVDVNLAKDDFISMRIHYGGDRNDYYNIIDVPRMNPEEGMDRILSAIQASKREGTNRRNIILRYNGQAVLKAPAEEVK